MSFKKFCAGPYSYGTNEDHPECNVDGVTNVNFYDPLYDKHTSDPKSANF